MIQGKRRRIKMAYGGPGNPYEESAYQNVYSGVVGGSTMQPGPGRPAITGTGVSAGSGGGWGRAAGGSQAAGSAAGVVGGVANLGIGMVNAIDTPNVYGNPSTGATTATGALSGAAIGATAGSVVPGIGTAIGAAAGAVIGGVTGLIKAKKMRRKERKLFNEAIDNRRKYDEAVSAALASDPSLVEGNRNASYYANGGIMKEAPLTQMYMNGGYAAPLNSNSVEMVGKTHAEGGIDVPAMGAELEDKETTSGNFVFSDKLGFAQMHKPIAKAIGKIEKKVQTPERIFALQRLREREESLALAQEELKAISGLKK